MTVHAERRPERENGHDDERRKQISNDCKPTGLKRENGDDLEDRKAEVETLFVQVAAEVVRHAGERGSAEREQARWRRGRQQVACGSRACIELARPCSTAM